MAAEPPRTVPDNEPRNTLVELVFIDFLEQARRAVSMTEVNVAAGVAYEILRQLS